MSLGFCVESCLQLSWSTGCELDTAGTWTIHMNFSYPCFDLSVYILLAVFCLCYLFFPLCIFLIMFSSHCFLSLLWHSGIFPVMGVEQCSSNGCQVVALSSLPSPVCCCVGPGTLISPNINTYLLIPDLQPLHLLFSHFGI